MKRILSRVVPYFQVDCPFCMASFMFDSEEIEKEEVSVVDANNPTHVTDTQEFVTCPHCNNKIIKGFHARFHECDENGTPTLVCS